MTFLLERPHPGFRRSKSKSSYESGLLDLLPIDLEVEAEPRSPRYASECKCSTVYRLTARSIRFLKVRMVLRRGLSEKRPGYLCECMGRVDG